MKISFVLASVLPAGCSAPGGDDGWPAFRGPQGSGVSAASPLPVRWGPGSDNIRWKAQLPGEGNSSPIASGGRAFLTFAYRDPEDPGNGGFWRAVLGLDLETGRVLWNTPIFQAPPERLHRLNTAAAATPVIDGTSLFVYFGSVLARMDPEGRIVWQREIDPTYARFTRYGAASSPVLTDRSVIIFQDQEWAETEDIGWLAAFDRETGERLWRREWKNTCCGYGTPLVVDRGSGDEVLVGHTGRVTSYAADDGATLWSHPYPMRQVVSSPMLEGDLLGVSGGAHNVRGTVFLRLTGSGAATVREVLWEERRFAPHTSSPVLYGGLVYSVTDKGVMACFDAETGELKWKTRLRGAGNRSSLVAGDGKVYTLSSAGIASVIEATGEEFRLLAENELGEGLTNATPAIAGGCLLLRTLRHLYCIEGEGQGSGGSGARTAGLVHSPGAVAGVGSR